MGFQLETGVSAITVFLQGILSFFSPCVLPLAPLYIGYLAGGAKTVDQDGTIRYRRKTVLLNTLFFVIGVSFAFFLLGFGFTAAGRFFSGNRVWFSRIGGALVILFGVLQLTSFGSRIWSKERRLPFRLDRFSMNPFVALVLGFTFSFAWTPCVGPALSSVLLMATSANSSGFGFLLIGVYTLGFVLPFLAVGLFTGGLLDFFKKHQNVVKYTVRVGGALMIVMGVMMITGWMNGLTSYMAGLGGGSSQPPAEQQQAAAPQDTPQSGENEGSAPSADEEVQPEAVPAPDFTLVDQNGVEHTLSEYRGKVVFLNFWATWCPPCQQEMPDIQSMYASYGENQGDLVVLGVANPKTDQYPHNQDVTAEEIKSFLEKGQYTYPTAMDTTGQVFANYGISSYPTTFMIDRQGNIFGYVPGMLSRSMMESIVKQTMEGKRAE